MSSLIIPEWPAPANVMSCSTTRSGGVSQQPYDSLNLGAHVADKPAHVLKNRQRLCDMAGLPAMPLWLNQVHGTRVVTLPHAGSSAPDADACYTRTKGQVCAVMTADCLPVIFCSKDGREVAAAHAGWRGLCGGVLESTLAMFLSLPEDILVWLGPAIGPEMFEVGPEVREAFIADNPAAAEAFIPSQQKYLADLWMLARQRLARAGVTAVYGGGHCTYSEIDSFFSYRRESVTGRMATLVWLG